jgi:hypothetical protein
MAAFRQSFVITPFGAKWSDGPRTTRPIGDGFGCGALIDESRGESFQRQRARAFEPPFN